MDYDLPNALTALSFLGSQGVAANVDGSNIDLVNYQGIIDALIDVGVPTNGAASPKLNFIFQDSALGVTYADITGKGANVTNTASITSVSLDTRAINRYVRVRVNTAGGNSPNYPVSVQAVATLKYNPS